MRILPVSHETRIFTFLVSEAIPAVRSLQPIQVPGANTECQQERSKP